MNKLLSTVSLCKRAGKLQLGFDQVKEAVLKGEAKLVLTAADLSEKSRKGIELLCGAENIESFVVPVTMDEFDYEIGKRTGIIAVTDPGFAGKLKSMLTADTEK